MSQTDQRAQAERFRALHQAPPILILMNAWDAASARIAEASGFPAVATSSAGIANALGYPDGEKLPLDAHLAMVRHVVRAVRVPVSVDFEAGYSNTPAQVAENCRKLLGTGAIGINLEDGTSDPQRLVEPSLHVAKIRAILEMSAAFGVPLVINARTDVYLNAVGEPHSRFEHAVRRANAYRDAGADCLFVPGVSDLPTIDRLTKSIRGPLNVLAVAASPPIRELEKAGVARVSLGSGPMRATLSVLRRIADELKQTGTYRAFTEGAMTYAEANQLFRS
ncbi:MAG: isocitrate lyase/PEP mutase family protein [Candidatus Acidiferrales bacterium]